MPICYVVPGLLESELSYGPGGLLALWPSPTTLALGQVGGMRLAANGIDPGEPDGIALEATGALLPFVLAPAIQLAAQLLPHGYAVRLNWYDWRKTMLPIGESLAQRVREQVTASDPCVMACHSHGGIIARVAWRSLVRSGQSNLVRRIVTLGTAHCGAYAPVNILAVGGPLVDGLVSWNQQVGNIAWGALAWVGYRAWTRLEFIQLAGTWPSLYEVMPVLDAFDSSNDPHRPLIFDATNWRGEFRPPQTWLTHARDVIGPVMRDVTTFPPNNVLTTVAGTGWPTSYRLINPDQLGQEGAISMTIEGDDTVASESALVPNSRKYVTRARHSDLFANVVNTGQLVDWLVEERAPTPEPPPPEDLPAVVLPMLPDIPGTVAIAQGAATATCLYGGCGC